MSFYTILTACQDFGLRNFKSEDKYSFKVCDNIDELKQFLAERYFENSGKNYTPEFIDSFLKNNEFAKKEYQNDKKLYEEYYFKILFPEKESIEIAQERSNYLEEKLIELKAAKNKLVNCSRFSANKDCCHYFVYGSQNKDFNLTNEEIQSICGIDREIK